MSDNVNIIVQDTINEIVVNTAVVVETIDINVQVAVDEVNIIANPNNYVVNINRIIGEQVQSDWDQNDDQAPDYIKNKPSIPTLTSDLINDGEDGINPFITANDVTPQVNSDWNATSGVAEILNKPTIPAAQVNSDWNATSGVAEILNKPTSLPPNGVASGDLQGNYPNPTVHRVHGVDFQSGAPAVDDTWVYVSTPFGQQPFQWQHSKLKTSQVQNDSTVTGTNADDALEHLDSSKVATTRSISTTTPLQGGGDLSVNRTLSILQSNTSQDGYLSNTDWNTFNGKFNLPIFTSGSVLFSNGTTIAQDNTNLFWDDTNNRLNIGGISSNTARLGIKAPGALSTDIALRVRNSADTLDLLTVSGTQVLIKSNFVSSTVIPISFIYSDNSNALQLIEGSGAKYIELGGSATSIRTAGLLQSQITGATAAIGLSSFCFRVQGNGQTLLDEAGVNAFVATSALLEMKATTKGFLPPRMTTTQKNAIASPATGLIVYDTTLLREFQYNGTSWVLNALDSDVVKLTGNQTITGFKIFQDITSFRIPSRPTRGVELSDIYLRFYNGGGGETYGDVLCDNITDVRGYQLPDASGTLALTSQIPNVSNLVKRLLNEFPATSATGTVTETLLSSFTIPANTFPATCMPNIKARFAKSGVAGLAICRLKVNTSNSFVGSTTIATFNITATNTSAVVNRNPLIKDNVLSIIVGTSSFQSDEASTFISATSTTFNTSSDMYLFVAVQMASITDTTTLQSIKITN
jgi:hypothetical protein